MRYFSVLAIMVLVGIIPMAYCQVVITIETVKDSYIEGETIIVSGKVDPVLDDTPVILQTLLDGTIKHVSQEIPARDGTYTARIVASGPNWTTDGEYTIMAFYGEDSVETKLQFMTERPAETDFRVVDVGSSGTIDVGYTISGGEILDMTIDPEQISLFTTIETTRDGFIIMDIQRRLIDSADENGADLDFIVLIDDTQVEYSQLSSDGNMRRIEVNFNDGDGSIQVIGTKIIPEFGVMAVTVLAIGVIAVIAVSQKHLKTVFFPIR